MKQGKVQAESGGIYKQEEESFIENIYPSLLRYGRFLAQNRWDGDDLAQEAIVRAFNSYPPSKINQPLLKKIAYNCWMDMIRCRKREQLEEAPEYDGGKWMYGAGHSADYLLNQLTLKQAVIFTLKEGFQYKSKEIAEIMQTTEFAVKALLNRARKQLQIKGEGKRKFTEEEKAVYELLKESVAAEDPTILINAIPFLQALESHAQKPDFTTSSSPANTLCLAA